MAQAATRRQTPKSAPPEPRPDPPSPICQVAMCPICAAVTTLGAARPDLVQHLLSAGREVLLALRAVIDARLEGQEPPAKLERLTID